MSFWRGVVGPSFRQVRTPCLTSYVSLRTLLGLTQLSANFIKLSEPPEPEIHRLVQRRLLLKEYECLTADCGGSCAFLLPAQSVQ